MTTASIHKEAADRLRDQINNRHLTQGEWTDGDGPLDDGHHDSCCSLVAMVPEVYDHFEDDHDYERMPPGLMPAWFAELTVWMNDNLPTDELHRTMLEYAGLIERSSVVTPMAWERLESMIRLGAVQMLAQVELQRGREILGAIEPLLQARVDAGRGPHLGADGVEVMRRFGLSANKIESTYVERVATACCGKHQTTLGYVPSVEATRTICYWADAGGVRATDMVRMIFNAWDRAINDCAAE